MTRTDHETPDFDSLSEAEIDHYLRRAHKLRAEQAGIIFGELKRWLIGLLREREPRQATRRAPLGATPTRAAP